MNIVISLLALLLALAFTVMGGSIAVMSDDSALIRAFGVLVSVYGVAAVILLWGAWQFPSRRLAPLAAGLAASFAVLWMVGSLDTGMISSQELLAAGAVVLAAALNWVAVRRVSRRAA